MQVSQQRLELGSHRFRGRLRRGLRSYEVVATGPLYLLGRQQSFHVPVADDEARDLQPRLFHKPGAEMHVMPEVVHAQLQILQGKLRSVAAELRRQCLFGGASQSEDRNAWHRWRSFLAAVELKPITPARSRDRSIPASPRLG